MTTPVTTRAPFANEAIRSFRSTEERASLSAAIERLERAGPRHYPLVIDGERQDGETRIVSVDPAHPARIVGTVASASRAQATGAIEVAARRFETWQRAAPAARAEVLFRAAELVRARRDDFDALLVLEVGKTPIEADADTAEAIDFLEFYAREALRYATPPALTPVAGEENRLAYVPLGVGVVIPPWNFAFAIMAGMTTAALVAGNTVVLKPSSDSAVIAAVFVDLLHEAGLPPGVLNFVPGAGRTIGDAIVAHPQTRFVAFTGSKEVGLHINELAAKTQPGQIWIKRVIAEMGGKDAIVVADDADLDAAAEGVAVSAFGFSGQKCSACSRAIVDSRVFAVFREKLLARVRALVIGEGTAFETNVGPVINEAALQTMLGYVETAKREGGRLLAGGSRVARDGFFLEPTVIEVDRTATIAKEEIFGPVLALIEAADYDDALAIANDTEFGLTGSVYSASDERLELARERFHVGNLYFNRKSTGAYVGGHPFGGFNMSGTDSKAGGADYLQLFTQAKLVSKALRPAAGGRPAGE